MFENVDSGIDLIEVSCPVIVEFSDVETRSILEGEAIICLLALGKTRVLAHTRHGCGVWNTGLVKMDVFSPLSQCQEMCYDLFPSLVMPHARLLQGDEEESHSTLA